MIWLKCLIVPERCGLCKKEIWEGFALWEGYWNGKRVSKSDDIKRLFGKVEYQRKRTTAKLKYSKYHLVINGHLCIKVTKPLNKERALLLELWNRYEEQLFCDECVLTNKELRKLPKYLLENGKLIRLKYSPCSANNWVKA